MAQRRGLGEPGGVAGNGSGGSVEGEGCGSCGLWTWGGRSSVGGVGLLEKGGALLEGAGLGSAVARRRSIKQGQNRVAGGRWVRVQLSSEGEA